MNQILAKLYLAATDAFGPNDLNLPHTEASQSAINKILSIIFGTAGGIAVIVFVVAGLRMVLSRGDPQSVNKVRNTVIYAFVGMVIFLSAFSIVTFVLGNI